MELRPGRHTVVSNTLPLLASSGALPLSARNVFAMITKGRGDTGPCFWTSGALSKSRGLPLLVKVKVKFTGRAGAGASTASLFILSQRLGNCTPAQTGFFSWKLKLIYIK